MAVSVGMWAYSVYNSALPRGILIAVWLPAFASMYGLQFTYMISSIFCLILGRHLAQTRWLINTYMLYKKMAKGYVLETVVQKALVRFTISFPVVITVFGLILPYWISKGLSSFISNKQYDEGLISKEELAATNSSPGDLAAECIVFAIQFGTGGFLILHFSGLWLWLCWLTRIMHKSAVNDMDGGKVVTKLTLKSFLEINETVTKVSEPFAVTSFVKLCVLLFNVYWFATLAISTLYSLYMINTLYCSCTDTCPSTSDDDLYNGVPTSAPTSRPTVDGSKTPSLCSFYDKYFSTQIAYLAIMFILLMIQAISCFIIVLAEISVPAYEGAEFVDNMKKKLLTFILDVDPLVRIESVKLLQVLGSSELCVSLLVCGTYVGIDKIQLVAVVLFSILSYTIAAAFASTQNTNG